LVGKGKKKEGPLQLELSFSTNLTENAYYAGEKAQDKKKSWVREGGGEEARPSERKKGERKSLFIEISLKEKKEGTPSRSRREKSMLSKKGYSTWKALERKKRKSH